MKQKLFFGILALLVTPLCVAYIRTSPPPAFDPSTITFVYDPNAVDFPLFCAKVLYVGEEDTIALDYYDPQSDPVTVRLLDGPSWASVTGAGTDWFLILRPTRAGTYYIDLQWEDVPQWGLAISAERTMLLKVTENGGPQPYPCGGLSGAMTNRQAFQVAKKRSSIDAMNALAKGSEYIILSQK